MPELEGDLEQMKGVSFGNIHEVRPQEEKTVMVRHSWGGNLSANRDKQAPHSRKIFVLEKSTRRPPGHPGKRTSSILSVRDARLSQRTHHNIDHLVSSVIESALSDVAGEKENVQENGKDSENLEKTESQTIVSFEMQPAGNQTFNTGPSVERRHTEFCYTSSTFGKNTVELLAEKSWSKLPRKSLKSASGPNASSSQSKDNEKRQSRVVKIFDQHQTACNKRTGKEEEKERRSSRMKPKLTRRHTLEPTKRNLAVDDNKAMSKIKSTNSLKSQSKDECLTQLSEIVFLPEKNRTAADSSSASSSESLESAKELIITPTFEDGLAILAHRTVQEALQIVDIEEEVIVATEAATQETARRASLAGPAVEVQDRTEVGVKVLVDQVLRSALDLSAAEGFEVETSSQESDMSSTSSAASEIDRQREVSVKLLVDEVIKSALESVYVEEEQIADAEESSSEEGEILEAERQQLGSNLKDDLAKDLNKTQLAAFIKLFSRFDESKTGGISAPELYNAIVKTLPDIDISLEEVKNVVAEFDVKGTGEIDFQEFLFALTNPKNYVKLINDDDREKLRKELKFLETTVTSARLSANNEVHFAAMNTKYRHNKKSIFFKMIKTATKHDSMKAIRSFYFNRIKKLDDHVIQDWSAGQRCIGLSHNAMARRFRLISQQLTDKKSPFAKEQGYKDSPYAKPLFSDPDQAKRFSSDLRGTAAKTKKLPKPPPKDRARFIRRVRPGSAVGTRQRANTAAVRTLRSDPINEAERQLEEMSSSLQEIRRVTTQRKSLMEEVQRKLAKTYTEPPGKIDKALDKKANKKKQSPLRRPKISEFVCTTKLVPLPTYPLYPYPQTFNFDDLPEIRQKAAVILEDYYNALKTVAAVNSKTIYKQMQVKQMRPAMRNQFKTAYLAYSGDFEPFVVSPWVPQPTPSPWIPYPPLAKSQPKRL